LKRLENNSEILFPPEAAATFDLDAFDTALRSQAVDFIHFRAMRCPIGLVDVFDERRPSHDDHSGCSNGFLYTLAGHLKATFTGNSSDRRDMEFGWLDGSTVQVTAQRRYEDSDAEVQLAVFDRLYLNESVITVPTWELAESHASGTEKLKFPIVEVVDLVDATGRRYVPGDYSVQNGRIVWEPGRGPGLDPLNQRGVVFSVRYTYRPYWYVARLPHQVRVAQTETILERRVERVNQAAVLVRENVFEKEQRDPQQPATDPSVAARQERGPREGIFGPR